MTHSGPTPRPGRDADFYEFGPFRLDVPILSLFRDKEFVPLTPKALDILFVLVENAGRIVTKDELMQRVWPDAFVEEGSIANHISLLRKALNPYFDDEGPIATVTRRGYRFTAPVTLKNSKAGILTTKSGRLTPEAAQAIADYVAKRDAEAAVAAALNQQEVPVAPEPPLEPVAPVAPVAPARTLVLAAAVVIFIAAAFGVSSMMRPSSTEAAPAATRRSVAVLPMKNLSGDASQDWLSAALSETISAELATGNQFRVVSGESVARMQQELAPPLGVGLTRKQLDDIGRDLASDLLLTGNFIVVGGKLRVDARLDEVATGQSIASTSVTDSLDKLLDIVTHAGTELRKNLGLDEPRGADGDAFRASFSVSPDALRSYLQGLEALRLRDGPRARDLLLAATQADDGFALAHSALSTTWRLLGYDKRGAESAKRAFDLSSRLSSEDRLMVEAQYFEATSSFAKAIERYQQLWKQYPDNIEYGLKLANAQWLGSQNADGLDTVEQLRRLPEREARDIRIDLIEATLADALSDYRRATVVADRAAEKAETSGAKLMLARARIKQGIYAYRVGKYDDALKLFGEAEPLFAGFNEAGGVADALRWQGVVLNDRFQADEALKVLERASALVAPLDYVRLQGTIFSALSVTWRQKGDLDKSVSLAERAVAIARETGDRSMLAGMYANLGTALRFKGDMARAREMQDLSMKEAEAIGDVRNRSIALNNSAVIDFLTGDLANARRKYSEILESDRKLGTQSGIALRLSNLSRVIALQGETAEAEKMTTEECRVQESLKNVVQVAWCRARLAELQLQNGRKSDADATIAQIKLSDYGSSVTAPVYIARFARVQLALGHVAKAAEAIALAEQVQQKGRVVEDQALQISTVRAEVDAAQGRKPAAIARLRSVIADADKRGLKTFSQDAQRVLARLSS